MQLRTALPTTALLAALALSGPAFGAEVEAPDAPRSLPPAASADRVIVEWEPGVGAARRADARADADTTMVRALGDPDFQLVRTQPGQTAREAAASLEDDPAVRHAVPDSHRSLEALPDDPLLGQEWGLRNLGVAPGVSGFATPVAGADINVAAAWDKTVGTPSTVVADIDSGYRFEHPDLADRAWTNPGEIAGNGVDDDHNGLVDDTRGWDFVGSNADAPVADNDPTDDNLVSGGHGVHTAGTIGAHGNDGVGMTGVAQDVRIMPLRVCSVSPSNKGACLTSAVIAAVNYAGRMGARVANLSLGGVDNFSAAERDAFASNPQTLFVISAGNDGTDNDTAGKGHFPCDYGSPHGGDLPNIVCVAASDQADELAGFSDYGATSVDLAAPGTEILSTFPGSTAFLDDFEAADFATRWTATGAGGGFVRAATAPLTSSGMTNAGQAPSTTIQSTSAKVTAAAAGVNCTAYTRRQISGPGSGTFGYDVLVNDVVVKSLPPKTDTDAAYLSRSLALGQGIAAGDKVQFRFTYAAGAQVRSVSIDDVKLECMSPLGAGTGYRLMEGTSMAAPHVTGAAALLFSLRPGATVEQVRSALLSGVDAVPALSGKTTTGGRLDAGKAVAALEALLPPPAPSAPQAAPPADPAPATTTGTPPGPPVSGTSSPTATPPAQRQPTVQGASSAPVAVPLRCTVPALTGLSLAKAKTLLAKADCALGAVKRPKVAKGRRAPTLVVASASAKAGRLLPAATKITLTLKARPKKA